MAVSREHAAAMARLIRNKNLTESEKRLQKAIFGGPYKPRKPKGQK